MDPKKSSSQRPSCWKTVSITEDVLMWGQSAVISFSTLVEAVHLDLTGVWERVYIFQKEHFLTNVIWVVVGSNEKDVMTGVLLNLT